MSEFILPIFFGLLFAWFVFDALRRDVMKNIKHVTFLDEHLRTRVYLHLPSVNDMTVYPKYWHLWTVKQWIRWADEQQGGK